MKSNGVVVGDIMVELRRSIPDEIKSDVSGCGLDGGARNDRFFEDIDDVPVAKRRDDYFYSGNGDDALFGMGGALYRDADYLDGHLATIDARLAEAAFAINEPLWRQAA